MRLDLMHRSLSFPQAAALRQTKHYSRLRKRAFHSLESVALTYTGARALAASGSRMVDMETPMP
jgi:hypothetical protein